MTSKEQLLLAVFAPSAPPLKNLRFCRLNHTAGISDHDLANVAKHTLFRINNNLTDATVAFTADSTRKVDVTTLPI